MERKKLFQQVYFYPLIGFTLSKKMRGNFRSTATPKWRKKKNIKWINFNELERRQALKRQQVKAYRMKISSAVATTKMDEGGEDQYGFAMAQKSIKH